MKRHRPRPPRRCHSHLHVHGTHRRCVLDAGHDFDLEPGEPGTEHVGPDGYRWIGGRVTARPQHVG